MRGACVACLLVLILGAVLAACGDDGPAVLPATDPQDLMATLDALAAIAAVLAAPVQGTVSRQLETRADQTALEQTKDPEAFIALQRRLALRAHADPTPPAWSQWWFGSHPTVLERIATDGVVRAGRSSLDTSAITGESIPVDKARDVAAKHPEATTHYYPAGHGFNCDQRGSYHEPSAKQARERSLEFFRKHLG